MKLTIHMWLLALLASFACSISAYGTELVQIYVFSKEGQSQIKLVTKEATKPHVFLLTEGKKRLVIDLPNTKINAKIIDQALKVKTNGVSGVRTAHKKQGMTRIVVDLKEKAGFQGYQYDGRQLTVYVENGSERIFKHEPYPRLKPNYYESHPVAAPINTASPKPKISKPKPAAPLLPIADIKSAAYNPNIPVPNLKGTFVKSIQIAQSRAKPVIVIDPGHGGRDPGAVGQRKVKEKTVTLKAGLELRRQLLATGKYRVVMTRSTDVYVVHEKRVRIARKAGADLFISLHADSVSNKATRGASVYTLAGRAYGRSQRLVNTQNWILDVDLSEKSAPVSDILVDLAQRKTLTRSGKFSKILIPQLQKKTRLLGNTHREAGYYVLLAPDVPAVLLEMGFISNTQDEALLNSAKHRKKLMQGVTNAINLYYKKQRQLQAAN